MNKDELLREAAASAPPASIAGLTLSGVSLQDWVLIATLVWICMQVTYFVYQRYKEYKTNVSN